MVKNSSLPHSESYVSFEKANRLIVLTKIIALLSENHKNTKPIKANGRPKVTGKCTGFTVLQG